MLILGSCLSLNLSYSGCCVLALSPPCKANKCFCDQICHMLGDCCSDISDIDCHHATFSSSIVSPTPDGTLGKTKCF